MRYLLARLVLLLALTACTASHTPDLPAVLSQPVADAITQQATEQKAVAQLYQTGKIRVGRGGVLVLQLGTGNSATPTVTDNTKAGQRQGAAGIGDGSPVTNSSKRSGGGVPWWTWLLVAVAGAVGWEWLSSQVPLGWLRWRSA